MKGIELVRVGKVNVTILHNLSHERRARRDMYSVKIGCWGLESEQ